MGDSVLKAATFSLHSLLLKLYEYEDDVHLMECC